MNRLSAPKVSVILAASGAAPALAQSVESVFAQTDPAWELLIVAADPELLVDYAERDPRVKPAESPEADPAAARNAGLASATGEYVCFLDSGDKLLPQALQSLCRRADADGLELLAFASECFQDGPDGRPQVIADDRRYARLTGDTKRMSGRNLWGKQVRAEDFADAAWLWLLRRDFVAAHQLQFTTGIRHADQLFIIQALFYADRAAAIAQVMHQHRSQPEAVQAGHIAGHFAGLKEALRLAHEHPVRSAGKFVNTLRTHFWRVVHQQAPEEATQLPQAELNAWKETLSPADRLLFEWTIGLGLENLREVGECRRLEQELEAAKTANRQLRSSRSYRLGTALVSVPRKLKKLVRPTPSSRDPKGR
jgi:hypothetical protein